jgi:hypothetical protein
MKIGVVLLFHLLPSTPQAYEQLAQAMEIFRVQ